MNLIIIAIILRIFFLKYKIYRHQLYAIIIISIISGSTLIGCILIENNKNKDVIDVMRNSAFYSKYKGYPNLSLFIFLYLYHFATILYFIKI